MKAIYCKKIGSYTNECVCEDTSHCPKYYRQGIGSLIENGVSNVDNSSSERTINSERS